MYFGEASAEYEVARDADQFLRSYLDIWGVENKLHRNEFFLVLGPKGSGKTAVGEFARLALQRRHGEDSVLSISKNLDDVSPNISQLSSLTSKLVSEGTVGTTTVAWKLFIGLILVDLAEKDTGSSLRRSPDFNRLVRQLRDAGLVGSDFPTVLRKVREGKVSVSAKIFAWERSRSATEMVPVSILGDRLIDLVLKSGTPSHYVVVIDGLDRIISDHEAYWLSLASLLQAGSDIHLRALRERSNLRLIIMCRSDVFRKVKFADADKIAGDSAIFVDWANQQTQSADSFLWDYLAAKSQIPIEEFFDLLPSFVEVGQRDRRPRQLEPRDYLMSSTRCTPREMTMLMKALQGTVGESNRITSDRIRAAVDNFASRGLISIMTAEAAGVLPADVGDNLSSILSGLPRASRVERADVQRSLAEAGVDEKHVDELCEFLFMAGLLGNLNTTKGYVQFYYRRDTYAFRKSGPWVLHRGLMYAYNVPW